MVVNRAARAVNPAPLMGVTGHSGWCTLTPLTRPDLAVRLEMVTAVKRSGVGAKWEGIDRPMRQDAQAYVGRQLERQQFGVLFEGEQGPGDSEPASVQPAVAALLALLFPLPGDATPPVLNVDGPVQGRRGAQQWQLESAEQNGDALRREADGYVWQVAYDLTLALHVPIDVLTVTPPASPAQAAQAAQTAAAAPAGAAAPPAPSGRTYTVVRGDTLQRIAQRQLGNPSRWREVATLNALRTPDLIFPGQVLRLP